MGHGYAVSLLDFWARFERHRGKEVFFPFSYHGTGMPIVACANKVVEELKGNIDELIKNMNTQLYILDLMKIPKNEFINFTNPKHWVTYFSEKAKEDLIGLNISTSFESSFITTDMNPYYDKFIKWQFNKLKSMNLVVFGEMPIIYEPIAMQACSDHDRSVGEGVRIKIGAVTCFNDFIVPINPDSKKEIIGISINKQEYVKVKYNDKEYITSKKIYNNLKHQNKNIIFIENIDQEIWNDKDKYFGPKCSTNIDNTIECIKYYEPEDTIISRSGNECVVAIKNQWYIDYSAFPKEKIINYLNTSFKMDDDKGMKKTLIKSIEWLDKWPVSRAFGLGTQLFDTEFLIDSLSDSTIYMALYPIYEILKTMDINHVNDQLFDSIYYDKEYNFSDDRIELMKNNFKKWYPITMRLSGKDLVTNHLAMCIMNHAVMWPDLMPKQYYVCGHVKLETKDCNGKNIIEKMSKSKGNFITIRDCIDKYGSDVTRLVFAQIESNVEDPTYNELIAIKTQKTLEKEKQFCKQAFDTLDTLNTLVRDKDSKDLMYTLDIEPNIHDNIFENEILYYSSNAFKNMSNMKFRACVIDIFEMVACKKNYIDKVNLGLTIMNNKLIKMYISLFSQAIKIFCPNFGNFDSDYIWKNQDYDQYYIWISNGLKYYEKECVALIAKEIKRGKITMQTLINIEINITNKTNDVNKMKTYKMSLSKTYSFEETWFDNNDEYDMINKYLKTILCKPRTTRGDIEKFNINNININKKDNIFPYKGNVKITIT